MQLHHTYWKLTTRSLSLALSAFTLFVCFSPALFELRNAFELLYSHLDDLFAALFLSASLPFPLQTLLCLVC